MFSHHIAPGLFLTPYPVLSSAFLPADPVTRADDAAAPASDFCPHRQLASPAPAAPQPDPGQFAQQLLMGVQHEVMVARSERQRDAALASILLQQLQHDFGAPAVRDPEPTPAETALAAQPLGGFDEEPTLVDEAPVPLDTQAHAELAAMAPVHRRLAHRVAGWLRRTG